VSEDKTILDESVMDGVIICTEGRIIEIEKITVTDVSEMKNGRVSVTFVPKSNS